MKTRMEYIKELRMRFIWILIPALVLFVIAFNFTPEIITRLVNYYGLDIITLSPAESISLALSFAVGISLLFVLPAIFYQMFSFSKELIPIKTRKEIIIKSLLGSCLAVLGFIAGITYFGKLVLNGLLYYSIGSPMWNLSSILKTTLIIGLTISIAIQMTWLIPLLNKTNITNKQQLKKARPVFLVGLLILSALVTPPDIFSMGIMVVPLYGSYETGLLLTREQ